MVVVVMISQVTKLQCPLLEQTSRLELLIRLHGRSHNLLSLRRRRLSLLTGTLVTTTTTAAVRVVLQRQWTGHGVQ